MAEETLGLRVALEGFERFSLGMSAMESAISLIGKAWEALSGPAVAAVQSAISVESAFAGVTKTTDGLVDEFGNLNEEGQALKDEFRDLTKELPVTFEELAAVGEIGGQLGVDRENLIDFTKTIVQLGETTNLTQEQVASSFAQIGNIMGTSQDEFDNMGSSIVALGNNMATTESDIVNFSQRIAGAGAVVGLTEADVFGISAAFSSLGVSAEAGGTAVQKVLLGMNEAVISGGEELEIFAAVAGKSVDEFAAIWEDDAAGAFNSFVEGLGVAGDDALGVLQDLGLQDQRLISAFLSAANAQGILTDGIDLANKAWEENTALQNEAEQRFRTTEARIQLAKNAFRDFGITVGEAFLPIVDRALTSFTELIDVLGPQLEQSLQAVVPLIDTLIQQFGLVFEALLEVLQGGMGWRDFVHSEFEPAVESIIQAFRDFGATVIELAQSIGEFLAGALAGFSAWFQENRPLILKFIAVLIDGFGDAAKEIKDFWDKFARPVLESFGELLLNTFTLIMQIVVGDWEGAWLTIQEIVENAIQVLQDFFSGFADWVTGWFNTDWASVVALWRENWENFKTILSLAWDAMQRALSNALSDMRDAVVDGIEAIGTWISENLTTFAEWGKSIITNIAKGISDNIKKVIDAIKDVIDKIGNAINDKKQSLLNLGGKITKFIADGLSDAGGLVTGALAGLLQSLGLSQETINSIAQIGAQIVSAIKSGIIGAWDSFKTWLTNLIGKIVPNILCSVFGICAGDDVGGPQQVRSPTSDMDTAISFLTNTIQDLAGSIDMLTATLGASVGGVAPSGTSTSSSSQSTTNNFNLTTQSLLQPGGLRLEFEAMSLDTR